MRLLFCVPLVAGILLVGRVASAQRGQTPREAVNRDFESAPEVGEPLTDVTIHDEQGKKFSLGSLRGKYAVLVFGCLT